MEREGGKWRGREGGGGKVGHGGSEGGKWRGKEVEEGRREVEREGGSEGKEGHGGSEGGKWRGREGSGEGGREVEGR